MRFGDVALGRRTTAAIVAASTVVAFLAAVVLVEPGPLPGELAIVHWMQERPQPVASIAEYVRLTTSTEACLVVTALGILWLFRHQRSALALAVLIALVTMLIAQPVIKEIIDRPRPDSTQVDVRAENTSMSFPSGHSMSTTTVWGAAALIAAHRRRRWLAAALCVPIVLTGLASSVQGVHWPSDALAGTLIGLIAACCVAAVLQRPGADST